MTRGRLTGLLAVALALALATAARAEDVMVFAAASTTNALDEVAGAFTATTGHRVIASYAASSVLAKQIERGAPAAVFLSADRKWMDYLAERRLVSSRADLLGNTLVLIAPADSRLDRVDPNSLAGRLGDGRLATGDPDHVPVGLYAKQALETLGQWAAVEPRLARVESVRAALALVERGEVPLGIVYATDAAVSSRVKVVATFPGTAHEPIVYPVALVAGKDGPAARAFLDHLRSGAAKSVFARYGFKLN